MADQKFIQLTKYSKVDAEMVNAELKDLYRHGLSFSVFSEAINEVFALLLRNDKIEIDPELKDYCWTLDTLRKFMNTIQKSVETTK